MQNNRCRGKSYRRGEGEADNSYRDLINMARKTIKIKYRRLNSR